MCNIWHAKGENAYEHTKRLFCFKQTWFKIIGLSDDSTLYIFKVWRNLQNRQHTWLKLTLLLLLKSQKWFKIKSSVNEVLHFPLKASDQLIEAKELTYVMQSFAPLLLA